MDPAADEPADGVDFPLVDGRRSTTATGRAVVADAVRVLDPALAARVGHEPDWRRGYLRAYRDMTALAAAAPSGAQMISAAGLVSVHERFVVRRRGQDLPLDEGIRSGLLADVPALHTAVVTGRRPRGPDVLSVPYRGGRLVGDGLDRRLEAWVEAGTTEPSFAQALRAVCAEPSWLDLRDVTVVVLGAGAQLGPLRPLAGWGAHLIAVDLPGHGLWRRMIAAVRDSPGRMSVPISRWLPPEAGDDEIAAAAGVDLLHRLPEVAAWLAPMPGPLTLGSYVYADGAGHVRATVAVDALTAALIEGRRDVSLAYLATPTDAFVVPLDAVQDSRRRYAARTTMHRLAGLVSGGRAFTGQYGQLLTLPDGREVGLNDSLVPQQGPNYALAKRIQQWRALYERDRGRLVSLNVAPATRTRSVLRNRMLASAYAGSHRLGIEVFDPDTSNTLMAALLVHDLRNPSAAANPATSLGHPFELIWQGANHGGLWRNAYAARSVLGVAAALGLVQRQA